MVNIDRAYIAVALVLLILGMMLGFYMGASANNTLLEVHIAMMLPGFVVLALYGAIYRLWPAMKTAALAQVQFWVAVLGEIGLVIGAAMFVNSGRTDVSLLAAASGVVIFGAILMAWLFWSRSGSAA